nr:hypothetical protein [Desulfobacteraceae bacterium]
MKNIGTIIFRLTLSCLVAGAIMGTTFILTNKAKRHNEQLTEQRVMLGLLGYSAAHPAPASLKMHEIYRYIVGEGDNTAVGYLVPLAGSDNAWAFLTIDLDGKLLARHDVTLAPEQATDEAARQKAIAAAVGPE